MSGRGSKTWTMGLLVLLALSLGGCQGAFWGNLVVLGVTVGIFCSTLALGRSTTATQSAEASSSSTGTIS